MLVAALAAEAALRPLECEPRPEGHELAEGGPIGGTATFGLEPTTHQGGSSRRFAHDDACPFGVGREYGALADPVRIPRIAEADAVSDGDPPHSIAFVKHRVVVAVNELGTEAAAATAVGGIGGMGPERSFIVNRPFVMAILDADDAVLFIGQVTDPR